MTGGKAENAALVADRAPQRLLAVGDHPVRYGRYTLPSLTSTWGWPGGMHMVSVGTTEMCGGPFG